jgi:hypothetical protein
MLGDLRFELGDKPAAAKEYEAFLKLGAVDAEVLKRLASLYKDTNQSEEEERVLEKLSALQREDASHPLRIAELAEARGALEAAENQLVEAAERAPTRGDIHLKLGQLREKRNQPREALEAYRAAAALGGDSAADADKRARDLTRDFKLPAKPAKGTIDKIYTTVSANLNSLYGQRLKARPSLSGMIRYRVRLGTGGKVLGVDPLEDTVGDPLLAGHVYFSLKDAEYPPAKREPVFEFQLGSARKGQ